MKYAKVICAGLAGLALSVAAAHAAGPEGLWERKNGDTVQVSIKGGKLYCTITDGSKPGFEMCHGMDGAGNSWSGKKMKHPSMPGFMKFNGTVSVSGNSFKIKGCAIGQAMCDSETWTRSN